MPLFFSEDLKAAQPAESDKLLQVSLFIPGKILELNVLQRSVG
jgi:hypothetical protein